MREGFCLPLPTCLPNPDPMPARQRKLLSKTQFLPLAGCCVTTVTLFGILAFWPGLEFHRKWGVLELMRRSGEHNEFLFRAGLVGIYIDRFRNSKESYLPIGYGKRHGLFYVRRNHWEIQLFWSG